MTYFGSTYGQILTEIMPVGTCYDPCYATTLIVITSTCARVFIRELNTLLLPHAEQTVTESWRKCI